MESIIRNYYFFSIVFTFILGTLLHFTYEWSNKNKIVATFSAVNESTWEHLKLLFFPMLITTIIGYIGYGEEIPGFICAKTIGIIVAILFTVIFFYTYTGILGKDISIISISSFFIAVVLGECTSLKLINSGFECNNIVSIIVLIIFYVCFIIFTFNPPKIGLFKDPVTGKYGIIK